MVPKDEIRIIGIIGNNNESPRVYRRLYFLRG